MDIKNRIIELLNEYKSLSKTKYEPTYLDICKYSGRRFEEICSRILQFYFLPNNEHGLKTLLIESLFESIGYDYEYIDDNIDVKIEVNAEGKRLDILIINNDWVIGIENKIWANVYNPLEQYSSMIEQINNNNFKIILTLHKIINKEELAKIKKYGFYILLYTDYINNIHKTLLVNISMKIINILFF